jgi:hypothetical protein
LFPTRLGYRDLGLKLTKLEEDRSPWLKQPPMVEEKRHEKARDPIKSLIEEALMRQRNEMMENFTHILQQLSRITEAPSTRSHFGGVEPFKVQVNFDIPYLRAR